MTKSTVYNILTDVLNKKSLLSICATFVIQGRKWTVSVSVSRNHWYSRLPLRFFKIDRRGRRIMLLWIWPIHQTSNLLMVQLLWTARNKSERFEIECEYNANRFLRREWYNSFVPSNTTINKEFYKDVLTRLLARICRVLREFYESGSCCMIMHQLMCSFLWSSFWQRGVSV